MSVTLKIKGEDQRYPTPLKAIGAVLQGLSRPDSGVDPLALGHAACVASAQAIRTNPAAGKLALQTLHQMTEAFRAGDVEKGIRLAVVMGLDSLIKNSRGAGIRHPDTCVPFERAYAAWAEEGLAAAPEADLEPQQEPEPEPEPPAEQELEGEVVDPDELAGLEMLFDDDDNEDDWADE